MLARLLTREERFQLFRHDAVKNGFFRLAGNIFRRSARHGAVEGEEFSPFESLSHQRLSEPIGQKILILQDKSTGIVRASADFLTSRACPIVQRRNPIESRALSSPFGVQAQQNDKARV